MYCLNATSDAYVWSYTTGSEVYTSSPAVAGGVVYVGSYDDNVYALNATTGALVWKYATGGVIVSSPAVANGIVYVGSEDDKVYVFGPSTIVPEFPSYLILPLFMMTTLFIAIAVEKKRKHSYPIT